MKAALAALCVAWTASAAPKPDLESANQPSASDASLGASTGSQALRVLSELQAANAARLETGRRRQAIDQARMELAAEAARLELEAARLEAETLELRGQTRELEGQLGPLEARSRALAELERQVAERIFRALEDLSRTVPPGVVPAAPEDPSDLQAALDRLERTERQLRSVSVEVVEGRLNGEPTGVELLRFGGAAAWWASLDGEEAGWARMTEMGLVLEKGPQDLVSRVSAALQMAKGRSTALPIALPLPPEAS